MAAYTLVSATATRIRLTRHMEHSDREPSDEAAPASLSQESAASAASAPLPLAARQWHGGKQGGKAGRKNWRVDQLQTLLNLVAAHQPLGADAWDKVARGFTAAIAAAHPGVERNGKQCAEKFKQLCNMKGCTGNPTLPPVVLQAQSIQQDMERMQSFRGSEMPYELEDPSEDERGALQLASEEDVLFPGDPLPAGREPAAAAAAGVATATATRRSGAGRQTVTLSPPTFRSPSTSSTERPTKRARTQLDTVIRDVLQRDAAKEDQMASAMTMMAQAVTAMAASQATAQQQHQEMMANHQQLMTLMLARQHPHSS
jgi:hypothetical protein